MNYHNQAITASRFSSHNNYVDPANWYITANLVGNMRLDKVKCIQNDRIYAGALTAPLRFLKDETTAQSANCSWVLNQQKAGRDKISTLTGSTKLTPNAPREGRET